MEPIELNASTMLGGTYLGEHDPATVTNVPTSVDWRSQGAVTDVKNQGPCGSCWAFATTGALEGAWQIAAQQLISLSEQQFVDCSTSYGNMGCNGGSVFFAFKYAAANPICTEGSYAYTGVGSTCQGTSSCNIALVLGAVTGYKSVTTQDTAALQSAVAIGPVAVAIEADKQVFRNYKSGVISSSCGTKLDHAVLVVGYGTQAGVDYWLVKNSWGVSWGDSGYVKIQRGVAGVGMCGIKTQDFYPIVDGSKARGLFSVPWNIIALGIIAALGLGVGLCCWVRSRNGRSRVRAVEMGGEASGAAQPRSWPTAQGHVLNQRPVVGTPTQMPQVAVASSAGEAGGSHRSRLLQG
eukprot:NODE_5947_length_1718_cov_14.366436.p2 GENE.NODE_5947_length_1718_cov_14.366436~~NODE_5947_length_1718_cov_14.366436.p2  ORF type:complete len:382 (+),score=77.77 NODE_5947_length_1718_cov_14.366436:95-1147(+)